jgi:transposase
LSVRGRGCSVGVVAAQRNIESLSADELIELVKRLVEQNEELRGTIEEQRAVIDEQRKLIDELRRGGKRQATPFSKGTRASNPKRPGRKPGQGPFRHREPPEPAQIVGPPVAVEAETGPCPACGGRLEHARIDDAYVTDLPELPKPIVTHYRVEVCRCTACGTQVRGAHPDVAPDQVGATASRMGPRVMAVAHWLHYEIGVPQRKVPDILAGLTGVTVTQSAIEQDAMRRVEGEVGLRYEQLRAQVAKAPAVNSDDTGWKQGGETAFLMAFETEAVAVYQIRERHRNEEVREVVPGDYAGVLCTDRARSYDAEELAGVRQQKCIAHIQRSIAEVLERKDGKARWFGHRLKRLLEEAVEARGRYLEGGSKQAFEREAARVRRETTEHLRDRRLSDADNDRLLREIGWHHDRGNLLRFLDDPSIEPTNNAAERALRPAVIARKVSHCTKNERGSRAYEAFKSATRTLTKTGACVIEGLVDLFRSAKLQDASP